MRGETRDTGGRSGPCDHTVKVVVGEGMVQMCTSTRTAGDGWSVSAEWDGTPSL